VKQDHQQAEWTGTASSISTRREFIKAAGAASASLVGVPFTIHASEVKSAEKPKLNVLLMLADDQRSDTIAALGNDHIQTPNLDRLVKTGFAFTGARCMGAQNAAVCVPARAMLHTGRSLFAVPENMGRFTTLGQALQNAGYQTFAAGKWHNGTPAFVRSFSSGGNIFFGGMHEDQYKMPVHDFDPAGRYDARSARVGDKFSSELFADAAVDFLKRQTASPDRKPFFCYLAFTSPHDPRTAPPPYSTMYDPEKMPLPGNWLPQHPFDNGELKVRDEKLAPFPRTKADTRKQLCDYYGMISSQDAQVGRVIAALEQSGQLANTVIVYSSDHGLSIGSHGLFGKQSVYEEAQRIPLFFSGPGVPSGKTSPMPVFGFDIFPTLCDLLDVPAPADVQGKSLKGIVDGSAEKVRDAVFGAYIHREKDRPAATQHAVHDGHWKYIRYDVAGNTTMQLFDLANDPHETRDLSQDAEATRQLPRLQELLARMQLEYGEPREVTGQR
jgi:arylsulfatase A-like enzyme